MAPPRSHLPSVALPQLFYVIKVSNVVSGGVCIGVGLFDHPKGRQISQSKTRTSLAAGSMLLSRSLTILATPSIRAASMAGFEQRK
jgi:hypothetical protein